MAMLPIETLRVARALQNFGSHLWQLPSLQEMFSLRESRNPHKALYRYRHGSLDMIKSRCRNNKMNVEVFEMWSVLFSFRHAILTRVFRSGLDLR